MKWYQYFFKTILSGIVLFWVPLVVVVIVLQKAFAIMLKIIHPISARLHDERIAGVGVLTIVVIASILLIGFMMGWIAQRRRIKNSLEKVERNFLNIIPGYTFMKSMISQRVGFEEEKGWKPVLIQEDDVWKIGFLAEDIEGDYCSIYFPSVPNAFNGEIALVHRSKIKVISSNFSTVLKSFSRYGEGASVFAKDLIR